MKFKRQIESYKNLIVAVIFGGFLIIGLSIYDNYGVHWDEFNNQEFGLKWATYVKKTIEERYPLHTKSDLHHIHKYFEVQPNSHPLTIQAGPDERKDSFN